MSDELPPANLILQALHAIHAEAQKTNQRLEQTNERLEALTTEVRTGLAETNARLDRLREFTVQGLTELNTKVDRLGVVVERQGNESHELNARLDNFLTGEGAKLARRVDALEGEVRRLASKVDH